MTNEELIKQLRGCKGIDYCSDCPRMPNGIIEPCDIKDAAADAIENLEDELKKAKEEAEKMRMQSIKWRKAWKTANELYEYAKGERKK